MKYIGLVRDSETPARWFSGFMRNTPTVKMRVLASKLNESFYPRSIYYNNSFRYAKLYLFVLFVSSPSDLRRTIEGLMGSIWWNPWAFYAIVDRAVDNRRQPEDYLSIAWNLDLKSSVFFCIDSDGKHVAYTFNYYGNPAPRAWRVIVSPIDEEINRTWDILKYELQGTNVGVNRECF